MGDEIAWRNLERAERRLQRAAGEGEEADRSAGVRDRECVTRGGNGDRRDSWDRGQRGDLAVPVAQFAGLATSTRRIFITENEVNGLSFPDVELGLVIFGLGYGIEVLSSVEWLREREIFYWGDIDTHGFAMLDRLRANFPHARSLLMDRETLLSHRRSWGREERPFLGSLFRLTGDERGLFDDLQRDRLGERLRLEQEQIGFGWVRQELQSLISA